jgi:triacylglycerol esterase/lipase EstA (alpha/beta hydrolase family)
MVVIVMIAVVLTGLLGAVPAARAATRHRPVIFVHGFNGSARTWEAALPQFTAAGYSPSELFVWTYNSWQSNHITASQFASYLDQVRSITGWDRVDVVTHSMGGLPTRWCIKFGSCANKIDDWVSLGGPNNGTTSAGLCAWALPSCAEMVPGSSYLTQLNAGDPTPGTTVTWSTWRSPCDGVVWPSTSTELPGAFNTTTGCLVHTSLTRDPTVIGSVIARVND